MRLAGRISLENKIETLRARISRFERRPGDEDPNAALESRITDIELLIERWAARLQGATYVIAGCAFVLATTLLVEPVREAAFSEFFPSAKRFEDVASMMTFAEPLDSRQTRIENHRSQLTEAIFKRGEAETGIMAALEKYSMAATDNNASSTDVNRVALAAYKVAVEEHLVSYIEDHRRPKLLAIFSRPSEYSREQVIDAVIDAGKSPFTAKVEGISNPARAFQCGRRFDHNEPAVEIALRPDVFEDFRDDEILQFLNCNRTDLPQVRISIATAVSRVDEVLVAGVVLGSRLITSSRLWR